MASLRRYGKAPRLMSQSAKVPTNVDLFGMTVEKDLLRRLIAAGDVRRPAPLGFRPERFR